MRARFLRSSSQSGEIARLRLNFKKTMKRYGRPENVEADKLRSYFERYRDKNQSMATRVRSVETSAPSEVDHALPKDQLLNRCLPVARTKAG